MSDPLTTEVGAALDRAARGMETTIPPGEKEELTQEAIVRVLSGADDCNSDTIKPFAYRRCQDVVREWVDRRDHNVQRRDTYWLSQPGREPQEAPYDGYWFLGHLPAEFRPIARCLAEGMSERKTAGELGITRRAVRTAKEGIRRLLARLADR